MIILSFWESLRDKITNVNWGSLVAFLIGIGVGFVLCLLCYVLFILVDISKEEKKAKVKELKNVLDKKLRQYDVTKPVLLLDEHTAALDPKTAEKVLETTDRIVKENNLTTIMITHNMNDAIKYGNRLVMMSNGKIAVDIAGEEKKKLTISQLLDMFSSASNNDVLSDSAILG